MNSPLRKYPFVAATVIALFFTSAGPTYGQSTDSVRVTDADSVRTGADGPCADAISEAESHYLDGAYEVAVELLLPCTLNESADLDARVAAYRLTALSYLKLNDLDAARASVMQLLSADPTYRADPVHDVPDYRALVQIVRQQLGINVTPPPAVTVDSSQVQSVVAEQTGFLPARESLLYSARFGFSSYGGERGVDTDGAFSDFGRNSGPSFELQAEFGFARAFYAGLGYGAARYPHVIDNKGAVHRAIDQNASTKWVHFLSATFRGNLLPRSRVSPYAVLGMTLSFHYLDGATETGIGPRFGIGADVRLIPELLLFAELDGALIYPGQALDLTDQRASYDPLPRVSFGIRHRFFATRY